MDSDLWEFHIRVRSSLCCSTEEIPADLRVYFQLLLLLPSTLKLVFSPSLEQLRTILRYINARIIIIIIIIIIISITVYDNNIDYAVKLSILINLFYGSALPHVKHLRTRLSTFGLNRSELWKVLYRHKIISDIHGPRIRVGSGWIVKSGLVSIYGSKTFTSFMLLCKLFGLFVTPTTICDLYWISLHEQLCSKYNTNVMSRFGAFSRTCRAS